MDCLQQGGVLMGIRGQLDRESQLHGCMLIYGDYPLDADSQLAHAATYGASPSARRPMLIAAK